MKIIKLGRFKVSVNKCSDIEIGLEKSRASFYIFLLSIEIKITYWKMRKLKDFWFLYSKHLKGFDFYLQESKVVR